MSIDARIAALARTQDNVVTAAQLSALGLSRAAIAHRLKTGRLVRVHRGVYAIAGAPLTWLGRARAAALAADGSVSHVGCAAIFRALPPPPGPVDVTRQSGSARHREGIRVHVAGLPRGERAERCGIPLTSPVRMLLDVAATQPVGVLTRAFNEAQVLELLTGRQLVDALPGWAGRRGVEALRALVDDGGVGVSRSVLEDLFAGIVRRARLPSYERNVWIDGVFVDAVWRRQRVVVELDSRKFHGTDERFETDREKNNVLALRGWLPLRFTYRRLKREPLAVIAQVVEALTQGERLAA